MKIYSYEKCDSHTDLLVFILFSIYQFDSFNLCSNYLLLSLRKTINQQSIRYWLYELTILTNEDFFLKPIKGKKSVKLYSTKRTNLFTKLRPTKSIVKESNHPLTLLLLTIYLFNDFNFNEDYSRLFLKININILYSNKLKIDNILKEWINIFSKYLNENFCLLFDAERGDLELICTSNPFLYSKSFYLNNKVRRVKYD